MPKTETTIQGERWDQLSTRVYGRPDLYLQIIDSNPKIPNQVRYAPDLPGGLVLTIPQLGADNSNAVSAAPWRR